MTPQTPPAGAAPPLPLLGDGHLRSHRCLRSRGRGMWRVRRRRGWETSTTACGRTCAAGCFTTGRRAAVAGGKRRVSRCARRASLKACSYKDWFSLRSTGEWRHPLWRRDSSRVRGDGVRAASQGSGRDESRRYRGLRGLAADGHAAVLHYRAEGGRTSGRCGAALKLPSALDL